MACLTTILLQILSNFANDYGDTQNGADLVNRIGPTRTVQSGAINSKQMFTAIIFMVLVSFISGFALVYYSLGGFESNLFWKFIGIGIFCILAAYFYTAGKKPYGYIGLGDISVFVFFGLVGVLGSCFLFTKTISTFDFLPAIACGCLSTGVLNLNNIRDIISDKDAGKITIPVRIGRKNAIYYHWSLLIISILCTIIYVFNTNVNHYYYLIAFGLIIWNGVQLNNIENPDPLLKTLALSTLAFVLLLGFSIIS